MRYEAKSERQKAKTAKQITFAPNSLHQGFTLIEVLIAMTLLGIMVVLLFSSLKICADSWEKGESKITDVNEVAVVFNFF
jgi:general secretion pathway protein J